MINKLWQRISGSSRELKLFMAATLAVGMAASIIDATFNNFLNDRFALSGFARSFLEFPRELPGFLVVFVSASFWFLCSRRLAAVAMVFSAVGALLLGYVSPVYGVMILWLFIYSIGQHLFIPLSATIGMELAKSNRAGKRLGQLNALRNLAAIAGSFAVYIIFKFLHLGFQYTFALSAFVFILAAVSLFSMQPEKIKRPAAYFKLHREYRLYYFLAVFYGSRKQIFLTFAPWVMVTIFHQPTQTLATLLTIGGVIGIIFQPFLGWAIDRLGERLVLIGESILLIAVCLCYGFARSFFSENIAFLIACICFLLDQMLMSVNMARSTYMKKIAKDPAHIQPALTVSVTIDHIFSIAVALIGGLIWSTLGYSYVFLLGALIAMGNLAAALHMPKHESMMKSLF
jgi:predicted MFS family arabinose efflux permease